MCTHLYTAAATAVATMTKEHTGASRHDKANNTTTLPTISNTALRPLSRLTLLHSTVAGTIACQFSSTYMSVSSYARMLQPCLATARLGLEGGAGHAGKLCVCVRVCVCVCAYVCVCVCVCVFCLLKHEGSYCV